MSNSNKSAILLKDKHDLLLHIQREEHFKNNNSRKVLFALRRDDEVLEKVKFVRNAKNKRYGIIINFHGAEGQGCSFYDRDGKYIRGFDRFVEEVLTNEEADVLHLELNYNGRESDMNYLSVEEDEMLYDGKGMDKLMEDIYRMNKISIYKKRIDESLLENNKEKFDKYVSIVKELEEREFR